MSLAAQFIADHSIRISTILSRLPAQGYLGLDFYKSVENICRLHILMTYNRSRRGVEFDLSTG